MENENSLVDKVALVTGATRGIGQAIALKLAGLGVTVIGTATSEQGANTISETLGTINAIGSGLVMDVSKQQSIEEGFAWINSQFSAPTIIVNNAGITRDNLMLRMKQEEWDDVINTNLTSIYRVTKIALRALTKARWGRIINISSVVGAMGNAGQANYAAAKAGIEGYTRALAREVASRNITVNAIAPGFIDTDMTRQLTDEQREAMLKQIPAARLGRPAEIAAVAGFLAGEDAAYITGETIKVNGGMYM